MQDMPIAVSSAPTAGPAPGLKQLMAAYERNLILKSFPLDTLMDRFAWEIANSFCTPSSFTFETNDVDPAMGGSVRVSWLGLNSSPHITWARVRNGLSQEQSVVDSATWFGIREEIRTGAVGPGAAWRA